MAALRTNATRLVEHLVKFLSEWIVTFVEPAREVTKLRDPELLFLHEKDYWFRAIWQDLRLAATLDRVKSRNRPPVGLVGCIQARGHLLSLVSAMCTSLSPFG